MYTQLVRSKEHEFRGGGNTRVRKRSDGTQYFGFMDNHPERVAAGKWNVGDQKRPCISLVDSGMTIQRADDISTAWSDLEKLSFISEQSERWKPYGTSTKTYTERFESLNSPLKLSDLMAIIPNEAKNTWIPEERIQIGFKYEFYDGEGVKWIVRAHAPEEGDDLSKVGNLFWTVRIQRGKEHFLSEEVAIDQKNENWSRWVKNIRSDERTKLAHNIGTPV
ncbi:hypothetical protein [Pseudoalteromonas sp. MMG005]|uniref:hypothetical protein n=1 Tax=Pseudoalteromonas sp. MMG005 TaxID=2822682 RepID=UPI001B3A3975|nr:hypothetical protein [Pseudoalteromonas sp. MMG005]MBQ4845129.1 hypothetical protein [Pseudoalteromonas sp. MMG005]